VEKMKKILKWFSLILVIIFYIVGVFLLAPIAMGITLWYSFAIVVNRFFEAMKSLHKICTGLKADLGIKEGLISKRLADLIDIGPLEF
jgi:hypothetical protein